MNQPDNMPPDDEATDSNLHIAVKPSGFGSGLSDHVAEDHDEALEEQADTAPTSTAAARLHDASPGLLDRLRDALTSKRAQLERAQRDAEAEEQRLSDLARQLNNLETARQRAEDDLTSLDAQHKQFVEGRAGYLAAHRENWRQGKYVGLGMAEIDFIVADYPEHRALLVEQLAQAAAAIKAFRRKQGV